MAVLAIIVVVYLVGYRLSLSLHPYNRCRTCRGTGRHTGAIFSYARRPCHVCFGASVKQRWGARMLGIGTPRSSRPWGRWAPPSSLYPTPVKPKRTFGIF